MNVYLLLLYGASLGHANIPTRIFTEGEIPTNSLRMKILTKFINYHKPNFKLRIVFINLLQISLTSFIFKV